MKINRLWLKIICRYLHILLLPITNKLPSILLLWLSCNKNKVRKLWISICSYELFNIFSPSIFPLIRNYIHAKKLRILMIKKMVGIYFWGLWWVMKISFKISNGMSHKISLSLIIHVWCKIFEWCNTNYLLSLALMKF